MAINKITDKETVNTINNTDKVFVNVDGELKQISKEDLVKDILSKIPVIQSGFVGKYDVPANSYKDIQITYPKAFTTPPNVVVGLSSDSGSSTIGNVSATFLPGSNSIVGFTARIFNNDTAARSPYLTYIASINV